MVITTGLGCGLSPIYPRRLFPRFALGSNSGGIHVTVIVNRGLRRLFSPLGLGLGMWY
jgi:hypothetical protein